jgi:putative DNA primase/helicase
VSPSNAARQVAGDILAAEGMADDDGGVWPAPNNPMGVARKLAAEYQHEGQPTLRRWRGGWMHWRGTHWAETGNDVIRSWAYERLEHAVYETENEEGQTQRHGWHPDRKKIADVLEALAAISQLSGDISPPAWLSELPPIPAGPLVACANGLIHVGGRKLYDLTPDYFTLVSVPFAYDADAPEPIRWLKFLGQLWPDDPDSIVSMQEWFGYVVSGRTDLHKILLIVGPTRSGKGTIARVLSQLIGMGNVAGPTLASLGTNFGLSPLLGKPLAVISDARLGRDNERAVVERLLSISGEDMLTVDRKYRETWTGTLPSRVMILSNELPRFGDASGAIAHRFVMLQLTESWLHREDPQLTADLLTELPGILNWALDGLAQLTTARAFTQPESSAHAAALLQDLVSPTAAFVRERCKIGRDQEVVIDVLYDQWQMWCQMNGHHHGSKNVFSTNLHAVVPGLRRSRAPRRPGVRERPWLYQGVGLRHDGEDENEDPGPSGPPPVHQRS